MSYRSGASIDQLLSVDTSSPNLYRDLANIGNGLNLPLAPSGQGGITNGQLYGTSNRRSRSKSPQRMVGGSRAGGSRSPRVGCGMNSCGYKPRVVEEVREVDIYRPAVVEEEIDVYRVGGRRTGRSRSPSRVGNYNRVGAYRSRSRSPDRRSSPSSGIAVEYDTGMGRCRDERGRFAVCPVDPSRLPRI